MPIDAILGLFIYASQPSLQPNTYQQPKAVVASNCDEAEREKEAEAAKKGLGRIIAQFNFFWAHDKIFGQNVITPGKKFYVDVHGTAKGKRFVSADADRMLSYLANNDFHYVAVYEEDWLGQKPKNPTAVIRKKGIAAYIFKDLKGDGYLPDGEFDSVICAENWDSAMVESILDEILNERIKQSTPARNETSANPRFAGLRNFQFRNL